MNNLPPWFIPAAKTITITLTDADGIPVNFADHSVMQITTTINKVEAKLFALDGDEFSDNEIAAVVGHADWCEIAFTEEDGADWQNGVFEIELYKVRGTIKEREVIQAFNIKLPAFA